MNRFVVAALVAAWLHACACAVTHEDAATDATDATDASDAPTDAPLCTANYVERDGACCIEISFGTCDTHACELVAPEYRGRLFCAGPQTCCARP